MKPQTEAVEPQIRRSSHATGQKINICIQLFELSNKKEKQEEQCRCDTSRAGGGGPEESCIYYQRGFLFLSESVHIVPLSHIPLGGDRGIYGCVYVCDYA